MWVIRAKTESDRRRRCISLHHAVKRFSLLAFSIRKAYIYLASFAISHHFKVYYQMFVFVANFNIWLPR